MQLNEEERNNEINLIQLHQSQTEQNVILSNLKKKEKMMRQSENLAKKYIITMDNKKQLEEDKIKKVEEMIEKQKQAEDRFEAKKKEDEEILKIKKEEKLLKDMEREKINERKKKNTTFRARKKN